jgi:dihydroflavonol-4-reductase
VDAVIHSAALIHIGWKRREEAIFVNRSGTENLLRWAEAQRVRFIHVSTVNVLPIGTKDSPSDETSQGDGQVPCTYVVSKRAAQQAFTESVSRGLDGYSIYPGFMLGPNDWQLSSGRMIRALKSFQPWAPSGGCSVCDPRDVSQGILELAQHGGKHRHYILAGHNTTYFDLWTAIAQKLGVRPPLVEMRKPARVIGNLLANGVNLLRREESDFYSAAIEMAQQFHYYSSRRAEEELGYHPRPIHESIDDAIQWLRTHNYL